MGGGLRVAGEHHVGRYCPRTARNAGVSLHLTGAFVEAVDFSGDVFLEVVLSNVAAVGMATNQRLSVAAPVPVDRRIRQPLLPLVRLAVDRLLPMGRSIDES